MNQTYVGSDVRIWSYALQVRKEVGESIRDDGELYLFGLVGEEWWRRMTEMRVGVGRTWWRRKEGVSESVMGGGSVDTFARQSSTSAH